MAERRRRVELGMAKGEIEGTEVAVFDMTGIFCYQPVAGELLLEV